MPSVVAGCPRRRSPASAGCVPPRPEAAGTCDRDEEARATATRRFRLRSCAGSDPARRPRPGQSVRIWQRRPQSSKAGPGPTRPARVSPRHWSGPGPGLAPPPCRVPARVRRRRWGCAGRGPALASISAPAAVCPGSGPAIDGREGRACSGLIKKPRVRSGARGGGRWFRMAGLAGRSGDRAPDAAPDAAARPRGGRGRDGPLGQVNRGGAVDTPCSLSRSDRNDRTEKDRLIPTVME